MAIIAAAVVRIKSDPLLVWGERNAAISVLPRSVMSGASVCLIRENTMALFVLQVLNGNTAITHLNFLSAWIYSVGSYCAARARLQVAGVAVVVELFSCNSSRCNQSGSFWQGRRVLMTDATTTLRPDTPMIQKFWPQPSAQKKGCGFPGSVPVSFPPFHSAARNRK